MDSILSSHSSPSFFLETYPLLRPSPTHRIHFGVRFSRRNVYPGYAKNAYPGLMYLHASGVRSPAGKTHPGRRAEIIGAVLFPGPR
jgi:hypothetical protein